MARSSVALKVKKAPKAGLKTSVSASAKAAPTPKKAARKAKAGPPLPAPVSKDDEDEDEWEDDEDADVLGDSDGDEDEDSEDEGVDEEGMARLMKLLGDDGLDEMGQAQLDALAGEDDEDDESSDDGEGASSEDGEDAGSDEEVEAHSGDEVEHSDEEEDERMDDGDGEDDAIPLDEADFVEEDFVPRQKVVIDDKIALDQIRESIKLDPSLPWTETLVLSYPQTIDVDVDDDLNRELAFYKQALHGANEARTKAAKLNFPFTRPSDYFAEMIKSDSHMERIRIRLLDETAGIKKSENKRKEREGKKFGKQVQVEKIKEREKSKKEMEERLKGLKRKRKDVLDNPQATGGGDDFDIQVEDAISDRPAKRGRASSGRGIPRDARDKKYGFGGATRHSKSNTRESTDDFGPGAGRGRGRGGARGGGRGGRGGGGGRGGRGGGRGGSAGSSRGGAGGGRGRTKRLGKSRRSK
ncbi:hypothetical protein HYPSUDRAFT_66455 [Hypholoma sublateritium FD-334 SS-4]|uniref:Ebp2-domain-containing protein n=1 Tax=Hypholoma sublateritium (strain FD-334 SS-4) TaxID=945553 RepID=A0A0D2PUG6_HYPSF|nr:hypothetical protein HYPSUDRAFT_66455 [Hypholoma sublateritium FD-334 SS-4]